MALIDVIGLNKAPTDGVDIGGNIKSGLEAGIGLATAKEQIEQKKIAVAQQKEQLEMSKFNSFNGMIKTINLAKPAIAKQMAPKIKERFQAMGFDPAIVDTVMADPEFGRALYNIANSHGSKIANNPEARAQSLRSFEDLGLLSEGITNMQAMDRQSSQNQFQAEQQGRQIQGQKDIAAMGIEKVAVGGVAKIDKETRGALTKANDKFKSEMKKETDALTSMQSAADLISQGGVAASAGRRALAKAFNSGAMTDQDVADIAGGKSLLQRGAQLAETALSGDLTPDNEKELLNIADTLIPVMQKKINDRASVAAESFSNIYTNVPKDDVLKILNPAGLGGAGISPSAQDRIFIENTIKKGGTREQALKFLEQKKSQARK